MTKLRVRLLLLGVFLLVPAALCAAEPQPVTAPDYKQALKYGPAYLRQFVYDTAVLPNWIGKTDTFWYAFRTSRGISYWKVDPKAARKAPLFDAVKLATALSEALHKPFDAPTLALERPSMNDEGTTFKFVVDERLFEYEIAANKLKDMGKAPPTPRLGGPGRFGQGNGERRQDVEQRLRDLERQQEQRQDQQDQQQNQQEQQQNQQDQQRRGRGRDGAGGPPRNLDYHAWSPDRKHFLFAQKHNLYLAEADKEKDAVALSKDGAEDYSFGGGSDERKGRPFAVWSSDSKRFYVMRTDLRGVKELYLVNPLAEPRPALEKYKYPMPGEEQTRRQELYTGDVAARKIQHVAPKWQDEGYSNVHWTRSADELRFIRRDRPRRHIELCALDLVKGTSRCLISEGFESTGIDYQPVHYVDESDEMIWWSERSGWGHFYLYKRDGTFKNSITAGTFRAARILNVDAKTRTLYFQANGREPNENVYYQHLYSVKLDGTSLTLLDPGDAHHNSVLAPTFKYLVDNATRVDQAPLAVLRDAAGKKVMDLEQCDLSRLLEVGWKMPETFVVKAADGVTDLYGNMWKPFDFDPNRRYPIIANVYPGPQQEGVTHTFSALSANQQLAQIGFIVIQVGHRGGSPARSKAYASYGYNNLRDYGLADKKTAIEQLAGRYPFIDINRVGIFGHSGGGFMSAAAVLQKPYNEFFKAAVASSGNHDNNIYGDYWAERYHGLKETPLKTESPKKDEKKEAPKKDDARKETKAAPDKGADAKTDAKISAKESAAASVAPVAAVPLVKFEIKVPTNTELAANLKGALLLVHGDMDNNVHPANTMRLVDALIKANKRFDMLILPGKRHAYGDYQAYFQQRMWEFFAQHLLDDRQTGADIMEKSPPAKR